MQKALILLTVLLSFSCKKTAGEGGKATITGKIWVENWDSNFLVKKYEYAGTDEDVYIIYGDHLSYDDKTKSNYNGEFEFKYLREGKYKVYIFSDKKQTTTSQDPQNAVVKEIEITTKKAKVDLGTITIYK